MSMNWRILENKVGRRAFLPGMTLVEVLVAMAIMVIGMGGFALLFLRSWTANGFILETGIASAAASSATTRTASELRKIRQGDDGSYPIESGDSFNLTAFLDVDGDGKTERVHYSLLNGLFLRGVTKPSLTQPVTYPSGDQIVTTVATYVANTTNDPIFSYYNDNYPGDTVNNPLTVPLAVQNARLVKIRLIVNIDPNHAPDTTTIESSVEFRNLN